MQFSFFVFSFVSAMLVGCTHSPQKVTDEVTTRKTYIEEQASKDITNKAAKEVGANYFVEVEFKPGSKTLSESAKTEIDALLDRAQKAGTVNDVKVLSWSDEEFPAEQVKQLRKSQRDLAADRNRTVETYITKTRGLKVEAYNMAKRPNKAQELLKTTDAKLKESMLAAGLPTTASEPQFPSKASHSVVLVSVQ